MGDLAVSVEDVSKRFTIHSGGGPTSLKERLISRRSRDDAVDLWALRAVSLGIERGETMGLLGHNGSGKSTLLKCIARTLRPTSGRIRARGTVAALLELGAGFHPDLTGRENVQLNAAILGIPGDELGERMADVFEFAELAEFADTPVRHYSSGMFARLGFSVAIHLDPDVLLVDEVLSVGDEAFQRKCIEQVRRLQSEGRTIVVVSHDADLVRQVCHRAAVLDHGELITVDDPAGAIRSLRELLLARGMEVPRQYTGPGALKPSSAVCFTDVEVRGPDPGRSWILPGEPLEVDVGWRTTQGPVDDLVFAMEIHDDSGNRLLGVNTDLLGADPGKVEGEGRTVFRMEHVPLLGGTYFISLGMHTHDVGTSYDHRDQLEHFIVQNSTPYDGRVHIPVSVKAIAPCSSEIQSDPKVVE
jgi:ABC-2 type transport system ATP-binding protein